MENTDVSMKFSCQHAGGILNICIYRISLLEINEMRDLIETVVSLWFPSCRWTVLRTHPINSDMIDLIGPCGRTGGYVDPTPKFVERN